MTRGEREYRVLGFVEVDSGLLVIGDPAVLLDGAPSGRPVPTFADADRASAIGPAAPLGDRGAVLIQGFGGDGTFPVIGVFEDDELIRLVIDLDPAYE
jgi:hypothetical protein